MLFVCRILVYFVLKELEILQSWNIFFTVKPKLAVINLETGHIKEKFLFVYMKKRLSEVLKINLKSASFELSFLQTDYSISLNVRFHYHKFVRNMLINVLHGAC